MIPLIPTLVLAFVSFLSSAFVILKLTIPILPPSPLSSRVSPAEFGLPNFRSLSPADKSHIWLACLDLFALGIFIWQAVNERLGGPSDYADTTDPASAIRLWFALTVRQTCLLIVASITLLHVRMGRSVSFGKKHWMLWGPTVLLVVFSTALAGTLAGSGVPSLFGGLIAYSTAVAVISSVALGCLVGTLIIIKRNLASLNDDTEWPPVKQVEDKPRPSFATEDIDAIRDGASWITSNASSRRGSVSAWSFSTHHTAVQSSTHEHFSGRPQTAQHASIPAKSSYWFGASAPSDLHIPPVPPLPTAYGPISPTSESMQDPDPFRKDPLPHYPRGRFGSQTSWLTSTNGSQTTLSAWSYPASHHEASLKNLSTPDLHAAVSRPVSPAMASAQVLGGYGYAPGGSEVENGLAALAAQNGTTLDISFYRTIGWFIIILVPLLFSLPYLFMAAQQGDAPFGASILLILSVTLSSPLLALNVLTHSPIPIPYGLFDIRGQLPTETIRGPSIGGSGATAKWSQEYKRSTSASITVIEGRRSGDIWVANGDAVDGKSKVSRAMTMLSAMPKLSVLPTEDVSEPITPPLPLQMDDSSMPMALTNTPSSENDAQFGRLRNDSKVSSYHSAADDSLAFAGQILTAQRHYSTLAQTVVVAASPEKHEDEGAVATGVVVGKSVRHSAHLRSRSVASISGPQTPTMGSLSISPPPSFPLPPTPPNVRAARLAGLAHKKSFSSGFSFGAVDDLNEIDALTAGVLPILVPGLKVGSDMRIKEDDRSPPGTFSKSKGRKAMKKMNEFGGDFSSPEIHSTPAARKHATQARTRKTSAHRKNHFSLPSLGLGKDGIHSLGVWSADIRGALEHHVGQITSTPKNVDIGRRNTVFGADAVPNVLSHLNAVAEEDERPGASSGLSRAMSTRSLGLRPDVPHGVNTARSSVVSNSAPYSAASTVTLFELENGFDSGPQAESTPHNSVNTRQNRQRDVPPVPFANNNVRPQHRRSSIVYIRSEDEASPVAPTPAPTPSAISSFTQWSTRAVRPLIPKASKIQRKMSNAFSSPTETKPTSPTNGLRQLTLLQERDANAVSPVVTNTKPLTLGKKQRSRGNAAANDENAQPDAAASIRSSNLKPLKLARSETSKMRGVLRKKETLPDVIIRPPSTADHQAFAYNFEDQ